MREIKKKLQLFFVTIIFFFVIGEIAVRIYAVWTDTIIAPNYEELAKRVFYNDLVTKNIIPDAVPQFFSKPQNPQIKNKSPTSSSNSLPNSPNFSQIMCDAYQIHLNFHIV